MPAESLPPSPHIGEPTPHHQLHPGKISGQRHRVTVSRFNPSSHRGILLASNRPWMTRRDPHEREITDIEGEMLTRAIKDRLSTVGPLGPGTAIVLPAGGLMPRYETVVHVADRRPYEIPLGQSLIELILTPTSHTKCIFRGL